MNNSLKNKAIKQDVCGNCGSELLPAMARCRECGTARNASAKSPNPSSASDAAKLETTPANAQQNRRTSNSEASSDGAPDLATSQKKTSRLKAKCRQCQHLVKAPVSLAGTVIHCPKCGNKVSLPKLAQTKDEKPVTKEQVSSRSELLDVIREALSSANEIQIESKTKKDLGRRSQVKKLITTIEACCGDSRNYETEKNAREAIAELVKLQSISGGETLLHLLPRLSGKVSPVAIRALGELQVNHSLEAILNRLLSSSQTEVEAAIYALGELGNIAAVRPLLFLPTVHPDQRVRASVAIAKIGEGTLPALLDALGSSQAEEIRFSAMESLKSLKSPKSLESLLSVIQEDQPVLRRLAVETLGEIEHPKKQRILLKLSTDKDPVIRGIVLSALARNPHQAALPCFLAALDDASPDVQKSAITAIGQLGESQDQSVIAKLSSFLESDDEELTLSAAESLSRLGDRRITPQILRLLQKELTLAPESETTRSYVKCLQRLKDPRAVLPLCEILETSSDTKLNQRVVEALGVIGDLASKSVLEHQLLGNDSSEVRASAAQALGSLGDKSVVPVLIQALHDSANVKIQALIALGKLKTANLGPEIKEMLSDPSPTVRYQTVNILSELGNSEYRSSLEPLVNDPDEMVQRAALKALKTLGDERGEKELRKAAAKSQRGTTGSSAQINFSANSVTSLFSGKAGGIVAGLIVAAVLVVGTASMLLFGSNATPSGKVVVRGYVQSISVEENGELAVVSRTRGLTEVWNLSKNERIWSGENAPASSGIVFSSRNESVMITKGESVFFYDISSNGELSNPQEKSLHDTSILEITSSPNRQFAVTLDADQTAHLWSIEKKKSISNRSLPPDATCVAVENQGNKIAAGGDRGSVLVYASDSNEPIYDNRALMEQLNIRGRTTALAFSGDGKFLAHSTSAGVLLIVEIDSGQLYSKHELPEENTKLYFNSAGELFVINAKVQRLVDLKGGEFEVITDSIRARTAISFCSQSNTLLIGSDEEKPVTVVKMQNGKTFEMDTE